MKSVTTISMGQERPAVAITGASGYMGSRLAEYFAKRGWAVLRVTRRARPDRADEIAWNLTGPAPALDWANVDALVHCAWDLRARGLEENRRINVRGSIALLEAARAGGVKRCVFISSLSAFEGCRSFYGQAKLEVERGALTSGCAVVRPGLVYGEHPGSMVASLARAVRTLPVVPLIGDGRFPQYMAHEQDLARLLLGLCDGSLPIEARPWSAAHPTPIPFRQLLETLASAQGRRVYLLPFPWQLLNLFLAATETLRIPLSFRRDSLIGFVYQNTKPDFRLPAGYEFRPFALPSGIVLS